MTIGVKTADDTASDEPAPAGVEERLEWVLPPGHPRLEAAELHLWRVRTDARGAALESCLAQLGARQHERAERMRHAGYRERYVRAQAGLRRVLAGYVGMAPAEVSFGYGPVGKPYLKIEAIRLSFNLSTTGDLALIGVRLGSGPASELGVDCEQVRARIDILGVAERMFDPEVVRALRDAPEPVRLERFYRAWTALEADAKCDGRGLFRPRASDALHPIVRNCIPESGYIAALASPSLPREDRWRAYDLV